MSILKKITKEVQKKQSMLCVGLDPVMEKIPAKFHKEKYPFFAFCRWIIEQTQEYAVAYKPNAAFFEARGAQGFEELAMTAEYLRTQLPETFSICDAKRGDIDSTNNGYVTSIFDRMKFDAVTLHPYLGKQALEPFLARTDKISIVLCRTSNPGAGEFQDQTIHNKPLWQVVAEKVRDDWNREGNCMLVVGATYPQELGKIRVMLPEMFFLVPGVGAQGGDLDEVMKYGLTKEGSGLLISASRSIIYADNPKREAQLLQEKIEEYL